MIGYSEACLLIFILDGKPSNGDLSFLFSEYFWKAEDAVANYY